MPGKLEANNLAQGVYPLIGSARASQGNLRGKQLFQGSLQLALHGAHSGLELIARESSAVVADLEKISLNAHRVLYTTSPRARDKQKEEPSPNRTGGFGG